jgi:riboflavin synthase
MFTGIVEEIGAVESVRNLGDGRAFRIRAARVLGGLRHGDSIAIDGACHTVTEFDGAGFSVQSVATTLQRTTLGELEPGREVNLERALAVGDRLGGHLVQGHVDGVGEVVRVVPKGELVLIDFTLPAEVAGVTVLHGSITLDGISLTVNALPEPGVCQVSIIPFTWEHTAIRRLRPGTRVNLEGDTIGKYVRHLLGAPGGNAPDAADLRRAWGY